MLTRFIVNLAITTSLILTSSFLLISCYTPEQISPELTYVSFDNILYPPTSSSEIKVYSSRREITEKYFEIGVIKIKGEPELQSIIVLAAKYGAKGIIIDLNNFILLRFLKDERRISNEI